jgi:hypothetical protein
LTLTGSVTIGDSSVPSTVCALQTGCGDRELILERRNLGPSKSELSVMTIRTTLGNGDMLLEPRSQVSIGSHQVMEIPLNLG